MTDKTNSDVPSGLDEKLVKKLARLARLALVDDEVRALVPELSGIVRHVDALRLIDTAGVPPMTHGAPLGTDTGVISQVDVIAVGAQEILGRTAVEQSAGFDSVDGMVRVPRVVD